MNPVTHEKISWHKINRPIANNMDMQRPYEGLTTHGFVTLVKTSAVGGGEQCSNRTVVPVRKTKKVRNKNKMWRRGGRVASYM